MTFNNTASTVRFIGNRNLEEVIRKDAQELQKIGGSFDAIAQRMKYFQAVHFTSAGEKEYEAGLPIPEELFYSANGAGQSIYFSFPPKYKTEPGIIEGKYRVWNYAITNGLQDCPFLGCKTIGGLDVMVANLNNNRVLIINDITIHLVEQHSLLEKDNEYGISATEFYEQFM